MCGPPPSSKQVRAAAGRLLPGDPRDLENFIYLLSGVEWGVICAWGSCQYATALAMFRTLCRLRAEGLDPTAVVGWGPFAQIVPPPLPFSRARKKLAADWLERVLDRSTYTHKVPDAKEIKKAREIERAPSMDRVFLLLRRQSWDLWSAAIFVAQGVFGTSFTEVSGRVADSPGVGPCMNVLVQAQNYTLALQCFALTSVGYVRNAEAFADFDT